jgi:hypothetical protein
MLAEKAMEVGFFKGVLPSSSRNGVGILFHRLFEAQ